jgi:SAM-dependent methyltransferase
LGRESATSRRRVASGGVAQNIYDDPDFFAAYSGLARSVEGLEAAPEWPALRALLPDVTGARIIDLGCGFGWFCRWAAGRGAARVLGLDLSERMLTRAVRDTADPRITYRRQDLDRADLPEAAVDLVFSSLALHYVADLDRLVATVRRSLVPGGAFVFSVEHPIYTAPSSPGFVPDAAGRATWPVDGYFREGPRTTDWLAPGVVKQHRTLATYLSCLLDHGFRLTGLREWGPGAEQVAGHPEWATELDRPMFLLVSASVGGPR